MGRFPWTIFRRSRAGATPHPSTRHEYRPELRQRIRHSGHLQPDCRRRLGSRSDWKINGLHGHPERHRRLWRKRGFLAVDDRAMVLFRRFPDHHDRKPHRLGEHDQRQHVSRFDARRKPGSQLECAILRRHRAALWRPASRQFRRRQPGRAWIS